MKYYVFDTKAEADECRHTCLAVYLAVHNTSIDYIEQTTSWSEEGLTRLTDGKYIVPYCDNLGDNEYTVEDCSSNWFPPSEYDV